MDRKLTLSLNAAVIDRAKEYARERETSLSRMIEQYLASLTQVEGRGAAPAYTPLVDRLSGVVNLPEEDSGQGSGYADYLSDKYQ